MSTEFPEEGKTGHLLSQGLKKTAMYEFVCDILVGRKSMSLMSNLCTQVVLRNSQWHTNKVQLIYYENKLNKRCLHHPDHVFDNVMGYNWSFLKGTFLRYAS